MRKNLYPYIKHEEWVDSFLESVREKSREYEKNSLSIPEVKGFYREAIDFLEECYNLTYLGIEKLRAQQGREAAKAAAELADKMKQEYRKNLWKQHPNLFTLPCFEADIMKDDEGVYTMGKSFSWGLMKNKSGENIPVPQIQVRERSRSSDPFRSMKAKRATLYTICNETHWKAGNRSPFTVIDSELVQALYDYAENYNETAEGKDTPSREDIYAFVSNYTLSHLMLSEASDLLLWKQEYEKTVEEKRDKLNEDRAFLINILNLTTQKMMLVPEEHTGEQFSGYKATCNEGLQEKVLKLPQRVEEFEHLERAREELKVSMSTKL